MRSLAQIRLNDKLFYFLVYSINRQSVIVSLFLVSALTQTLHTVSFCLGHWGTGYVGALVCIDGFKVDGTTGVCSYVKTK